MCAALATAGVAGPQAPPPEYVDFEEILRKLLALLKQGWTSKAQDALEKLLRAAEDASLGTSTVSYARWKRILMARPRLRNTQCSVVNPFGDPAAVARMATHSESRQEAQEVSEPDGPRTAWRDDRCSSELQGRGTCVEDARVHTMPKAPCQDFHRRARLLRRSSHSNDASGRRRRGGDDPALRPGLFHVGGGFASACPDGEFPDRINIEANNRHSDEGFDGSGGEEEFRSRCFLGRNRKRPAAMEDPFVAYDSCQDDFLSGEEDSFVPSGGSCTSVLSCRSGGSGRGYRQRPPSIPSLGTCSTAAAASSSTAQVEFWRLSPGVGSSGSDRIGCSHASLEEQLTMSTLAMCDAASSSSLPATDTLTAASNSSGRRRTEKLPPITYRET
eukprot:TRINITY_DN102564_c0_g1_i1.p1 TRINITY_DN102564_c0_g1~~TRINITY_DN102564_c0_g1_i1.p1  ORF type:complete len:388 (-),score=56.54 TRINITY_DN102564_c0_g1_i1:243-1406(-)